MQHSTSFSVYNKETDKFNALADQWWDPKGKFRPLHLLQPCRLDFINSQIEIEFDRQLGNKLPFTGLTVLDVGAGGGLLCEPLARLGATVTGIDLAARSIAVARVHAEQSGLNITYRHISVKEMAAEGHQFDIVLCMEVIEHVPDQQSFVTSCAKLVNSNGIMICSTISRNPKSYALAIVGAEYILRWLPRGTHQWRKFVKPSEFLTMQKNAGLKPIDCKGMVFNPIKWTWNISSRDTSINYITAAKKLEIPK